ncbi:hypothetical protein C8Q79DRAFT_908941 [Trametes meyenii]|nr:hypothetical protein C8Q79DRAFT_908941 [Trametes meyenii]
MALALPAPSSTSPSAMPLARSSPIKTSSPDRRIGISSKVPSLELHLDAPGLAYNPASLSPAESDDVPLSPIVFHPNEEYEKNRLSYCSPAPRAASTPSSPDHDIGSPLIFSHSNLSSPTLTQPPPPPVFPTEPSIPSSTSIRERLKRPLPSVPGLFAHSDSHGTQTGSRQEASAFWRGGRTSPSGSDGRDSDSLTAFSLSGSSQSPVTSDYTTASSSPPDSAKAFDGFFPTATKPKHLALTIPARSQSAPLPPTQMPGSFADRFFSPHISVTPASPGSSNPFVLPVGRKRNTRRASEASIVVPSGAEDESGHHGRGQPPARSPSPAPSLTLSISSTRSGKSSPKSTLKRIASKTKLFGRRTLSTASDPWADDDDDTIVGHGSLSMDEPTLHIRARSESPLGSVRRGSALASADAVPRAMRRVEIAEVTLTPQGDVWEERELEEVIPILRQLRAPAKIKI